MNPILQKMNSNNPMNNIKSLLNGDPNVIYNRLMQTNPQFSQFVKQNEGKTATQIAQEHGIDPSILGQFLK